MATSTPASPVTVSRIPDPGEPIPGVALPTLMLFATGVVIWAAGVLLHLFTNHQDGLDPDVWTLNGPRWLLPFRWATVDMAHMAHYARNVRKRPRRECQAQFVQLTLIIAVIAAAVATGHATDVLLLWFLPARITFFLIGFLFDFLPHNGGHATPGENRYRTATVRLGAERITSPAMLYQNYHLVHHMHPLVPFYRYLRVWSRNEKHYVDNDAAITSLRGRPITPDEYRRLRELADHGR